MKRKSEYSEKLRDPRWQKLRLLVMERDKFACRFCMAEDKTLNVHHLAYNGDPWEVPMDALLTLCENCHEEETSYLAESVSDAVRDLKLAGFSSRSFGMLAEVFSKNRGWADFEPRFSVLKMVVDDDDLWNDMEALFWERLRGKSKTNIEIVADAEQDS